MLQCLLILNGLSVLPFEILFEEVYNKAVKNHFGIKWKYKASSCVCFFSFLKYAFRKTFFNDFKCCSEMAKKKKKKKASAHLNPYPCNFKKASSETPCLSTYQHLKFHHFPIQQDFLLINDRIFLLQIFSQFKAFWGRGKVLLAAAEWLSVQKVPAALSTDSFLV